MPVSVLFKVLLILHITGGCIGLICGTISIIRRKGDRVHTLIGKLFCCGMLTAGASSLVLSVIHSNYFLFIVGVFTVYMVGTGQRSLKLKALARGQKPEYIDYILTYGMLVFSVAFIALGIYQLTEKNSLGIVFLAFGLLSIRMVKKDIYHYKGKAGDKNQWLIVHLQRMSGAYAASATAFLVVNSPDFLPTIVVWLLPTAIILPLIIKWTQKFSAKFAGRQTNR